MIEKISLLIVAFGGRMILLEFIVLYMILFTVCSFINFRKVKTVVSLFFSVFILVQISSLYFTQSFAGYQYYVHFNMRGAEGLTTFFYKQILFGCLFFIGTFFLMLNSKKIMDHVGHFFLKRHSSERTFFIIKGLIILPLIIGLIWLGNFFIEFNSFISIVSTNKQEDFKAVLLDNGFDNYISPEEIEATAGKNIIVLSLESFEKAFLESEFQHLSPNISKLRNIWNYYELDQNSGSEWTSGSLYTSLTGFPAFFSVYGNLIFQSAYKSKISSINHALKKAGYYSLFFNGNAGYSGTKEMLYCLKFDNVVDKNTAGIDRKRLSEYGIRDFDLFSIAKSHLKSLSQKEEPYFVILSTTDTHYPNGIYDVEMESYISPQKSDLEFMISALDYMVGDFVNFLENEGILSNSVVFIYPDHLKMGDPSIFSNIDERGLFLMTNADVEDLDIDAHEELYQIDIPRIILNGAKVESNIRFLTDYISGDKPQYLKRNMGKLTKINTSGLLRFENE